ncbi:MAG: hypothetical protein AAF493_19740 [Pseudomonadota bacterium]
MSTKTEPRDLVKTLRHMLIRLSLGAFVMHANSIFANPGAEHREKDTPDSSVGASRDVPALRGMIDRGRAAQAVRRLELLVESEHDNAELHSALGYGYRRLERYDDSRAAYLRALHIRPVHPGTNEALGELYLILGELNLAQERLLILENVCSACDETAALRRAIEKHIP